ncbi:DUF211 domain-containing protein [Salinibaculum salinum]|uniref:DUF211 domain-containing protein n=1 Tax=Salinibaculum salinum TaxID=3131996 RepID=UPI0030EE3F53
MAPIRRLVIDVLKPHEPPLIDFTDRITETEGVDAATATLIELDQEVQNVKISIEGEELAFDTIEETVDHLGGTVHSVDEVSCGDYVVEDRRTLQD